MNKKTKVDISTIKEIREAYNLSRIDFAKKLNITIETLNTWEYRTKKIPSRKIIFIKQVFSAFFKGEEILAIPKDYYMTVEYFELNELKDKIELGTISILSNDKKRLVPRTDDKGNYLVVRVVGHSMDDNTKRSISDGEEILIREYNDRLNMLPIRNKLFVFVTDNDVIIKQVVNNSENTVTCHSFNPKHDDFKLSYKEISQVYTVEKKVRSNIIF